jgi:hypothetical protein
LEFITSAEALKYVLQHNFRNIGTGSTKIENGEFAIQDSTAKRDVNFELPWETCFSAGQQVDMSMVFNSAKATNMHCPKCHEDNGDDFTEDEDIECRKCKMVYRRTISWTSPQSLPSFSMTTAQITPAIEIPQARFEVTENVPSSKSKRKLPHDEDEEMALFRRVRIKTLIVLPAPDSRPGSPENEDIIEDQEPPFDGDVVNLDYLDELERFHKARGRVNFNPFPSVDKRTFNLYKLRNLVEARGGFERVCKMKHWREVAQDMGYSGKIMSSLSTSLKNWYQRWLFPYEEYLLSARSGVHQQPDHESGGPPTPSPATSLATWPRVNIPVARKTEGMSRRSSKRKVGEEPSKLRKQRQQHAETIGPAAIPDGSKPPSSVLKDENDLVMDLDSLDGTPEDIGTEYHFNTLEFTPLVSPATTPLENHSNNFENIVPGTYFSPFSSPTLHAQDFRHAQIEQDLTLNDAASVNETAANMMRQMEVEGESAEAGTGLRIGERAINTESRVVDIEASGLASKFSEETPRKMETTIDFGVQDRLQDTMVHSEQTIATDWFDVGSPPSGSHSFTSGVNPRKRDNPLPPIIVEDHNVTIAMKRARNILAARKSRQRKMMRFGELEDKVAKLEAERDHWKEIGLRRRMKPTTVNEAENREARGNTPSWADFLQRHKNAEDELEEADSRNYEDAMASIAATAATTKASLALGQGAEHSNTILTTLDQASDDFKDAMAGMAAFNEETMAMIQYYGLSLSRSREIAEIIKLSQLHSI